MTDYSRVYSGKLHRHSINNTNDYISRQAAIKALIGGSLSAATLYGRTEEGMTVLREYTNNIRRIPSADVRENIQLDVCPLYGGACGYPSGECYDCPRHGNFRENVRGYWEKRKDKPLQNWYQCSNCGAICGETPKYCSECGADMGGEA